MDARLSDGSRVNVVLDPVALNGPILTIRKFPEEAITMEKLIEWESLSQEAADYLKILVQAGYNIFYQRRHKYREDDIFKCAGRLYSEDGKSDHD